MKYKYNKNWMSCDFNISSYRYYTLTKNVCQKICGRTRDDLLLVDI